jgi:hypothetical protein
MPAPSATLIASAAGGGNNITSVNLISGGSGYTAPNVFAPGGVGGGATFSATVVGGVITAISVLTEGVGYPFGTNLIIQDATGSGAVAQGIVTDYVTFTASAEVFGGTAIGDVIRMGGGIASVVQVVSAAQVVANMTTNITATVQNDPNNMPLPAAPGSWTITTPVSVLSGLNHLEGLTVAIVADGGVQPNQVVTNGMVTLQNPASAITIGLPFLPQLQTPYLDPAGQQDTPQGKRKTIFSVTVRVEASRGFSVGQNQIDASSQPNGGNHLWGGLVEVKERNASVFAGNAIPLATDDFFLQINGEWKAPGGQVAIQQDYPLPCNVLAVIANYDIGDTSA